MVVLVVMVAFSDDEDDVGAVVKADAPLDVSDVCVCVCVYAFSFDTGRTR